MTKFEGYLRPLRRRQLLLKLKRKELLLVDGKKEKQESTSWEARSWGI